MSTHVLTVRLDTRGKACLFVCLFLLLSFCLPALTQSAPSPEEWGKLAESFGMKGGPLAAPGSREVPEFQVERSDEGYIRAVRTGGGTHLPTLQGGSPENRAQAFLEEFRGLLSPQGQNTATFRMIRETRKGDGSRLKFRQEVGGIPVFGAQVLVQINDQGGVEYVLSDISRDEAVMEGSGAATRGGISALDAVGIVSKDLVNRYDESAIRFSDPELMIFDPRVLGSEGTAASVWVFEVTVEGAPTEGKQVLVDTHTGAVVREYPHLREAMDRQIYDSENTTADPGDLVRSEGEVASGILDADTLYDALGDSYGFYADNHQRDGIDDAGMGMSGTVRYCDPRFPCPLLNAYWSSNRQRLYFGEGYVVDDIVGHEFTHGVTQNESDLIYENHSGAINESFSDIWGEFIDLGNGRGLDTAEVRWEIGEDLPDLPRGAIRDMEDPTVFDHPDRLGSPLFIPPVETPLLINDFGGVHTNSGVGNRLCSLLVDGGTFNGQVVSGLGIPTVAGLFYEVQTGLLTQSADYHDLGIALRQAAVNLGLTEDQEFAVLAACVAVEIVSVNFANVAGRVATSDGVGVANVTLDAGVNTVSSGPDGHYSLMVPEGWTGVVTPHRDDWVFDPPSITYSTPVVVGLTNENYQGNGLPDLRTSEVQTDPAFEGDTLTFTVQYKDEDGRAPSVAYLWIDGIESHEMTSAAQDFSTFQPFECTFTLPAGTYEFHYSFKDGDNESTRLPADGRYSLEVSPLEPEIHITSPIGTEPQVDDSFLIQWTATNVQSVDLYYDVDFDPASKTLIVLGTENDGEYLWDVSGMPDGAYTIYGEVDNQGDVDWDYGSGYVLVNHNPGASLVFAAPVAVTIGGSMPRLAVDRAHPDRMHLVWRGPGGVHYSRSLDGGFSWTESVISSVLPANLELAMDQVTGTLHCTFELDPYGYYLRSADGGETWGNDLQFGTDVEDEVQISAHSGNVAMAWLSWSPGYGIIKSRCSGDDGVSWGGEVIVFDAGDDASDKYDIVNYDGDSAAVMYSAAFDPQDEYVHVKFSSNGGCSWGGERNPGDPDNREPSSFNLGARGDRLMVSFLDELVYMFTTDDGGSTWSAPLPVPIPGGASHDLAVLDHGVGMVYVQGPSVAYLGSNNDGLTWGSATVLTDVSTGNTPSIAGWDDDVAVAYVELGTGIVVRRSVGGSSSWMTLSSPNGGEVVETGSVHTIEWNAPPEVPGVAIDYSPDGGASWEIVVSDAPNYGTFGWFVPDETTLEGIIRVTSTGNPALTDRSARPFQVRRPHSPVAWYDFEGDGLDGSIGRNDGDPWNVQWASGIAPGSGLAAVFSVVDSSYVTVPDDLDLQFGTDPWAVSLWVQHDSVESSMKYVWKQRGYPHSGSYAGLMCSLELLDGYPRFTLTSGDIHSDPSLSFTRAQSQTVVEPGRWYHVVFQRTASRLEIWVDGVLDGMDSGFGWDIDIDNANPLVIGANRDRNGSFLDGKLDQVGIFAHELSEAQIQDLGSASQAEWIALTSPTGFERLLAGDEQPITWVDSGLGFVDLAYSADGGASWVEIVAGLSNVGSFSWTVPEVVSATCLMRASSSADPLVQDVCDGYFEIGLIRASLAHWALDGDALDSSGNGFDGSVFGVDWVNGVGEQSPAAHFTSIEQDYIQVDHDPAFDFGTGPWAVSMWVNHDTVDSSVKYVWKQRGSPHSGSYAGMLCSLDHPDGNPRFTLRSGDINDDPDLSYTYAYSQTVVAPGNWYHVVFQRTEQQLEIWVNGKLDAVDAGFGWDVDIDNENPLVIGANRDLDGGFLDGVLDDVQVFSGWLGAGEVNILYQQGWDGVASVGEGVVAGRPFEAAPPAPNPFNPRTTIGFDLNVAAPVSIKIYDVRGHLVDSLADRRPFQPGFHELVWNGADRFGRQVAGGVYFYRIDAAGYSETKRMVLVR